MLLRLVAIGLLATLTFASDATASSETARDKNNLIGLVRTVTTKAQGLLQTETYDFAGRLTEAAIYQEHFNISTSYVFTYDQHGRLREEIAYDDARTLIYRKLFAYAYDSAGRETAVVPPPTMASFTMLNSQSTTNPETYQRRSSSTAWRPTGICSMSSTFDLFREV